jgi:hypothetical protein
VIAAAITVGRVVWAVAVPLALYAGQTAIDVWAEKQKRKPRRVRKPVRKAKKR